MSEVFLAEKHISGPDVLGVFSSMERGKKACQDDANRFFGAARTEPLSWRDNVKGGHSSASYHNPASGMSFYQVTRFTVDEVRDVS